MPYGGATLAKHRPLNLRRLVNAVPWDLFEQYFAQLKVDHRPDAWAYINPDAMFHFLENPQNVKAGAIIKEDFKRVNDICAGNMALVVRAYRHYNVPLDQNEADLAQAMRLFLHHRQAFNYAWSRYLFHSPGARVTLFPLPGLSSLEVPDASLARFQEELSAWFRHLGKGEQCQVSRTDEGEQVVFLISHGSYVRTVAHWQEKQLEIFSYRAAAEDVVVYDREHSTLAMRAAVEKDRGEYLRAFAEFIAGDIKLKDRALSAKAFSLVPIQNGTFDFAGKDDITDIKLVEVGMKLGSYTSSVITIESEDVQRALRRELTGLSLANGELTRAKFMFRVEMDGERPQNVIFDVYPPMRTDLVQKRYADLIEGYLREQGVMLA